MSRSRSVAAAARAFSSAFSGRDWSFSLPDLCGAGGAGEHVASVRAFAPALSTSGALRCRWEMKTGDRVLMVYPPGLEFAVAFLGCLYAGVTAVPYYPPALPMSVVPSDGAWALLARALTIGAGSCVSASWY